MTEAAQNTDQAYKSLERVIYDNLKGEAQPTQFVTVSGGLGENLPDESEVGDDDEKIQMTPAHRLSHVKVPSRNYQS